MREGGTRDSFFAYFSCFVQESRSLLLFFSFEIRGERERDPRKEREGGREGGRGHQERGKEHGHTDLCSAFSHALGRKRKVSPFVIVSVS